jgi:hypothetical protein
MPRSGSSGSHLPNCSRPRIQIPVPKKEKHRSLPTNFIHLKIYLKLIKDRTIKYNTIQTP